MLASGREIDTKTRSSFNNKTAAEQGRVMAQAKEDHETEEDSRGGRTMAPSVLT